MFDKRIINGNVYISNSLVKTNVYINGEFIVQIEETLMPAQVTIDAKGALVLPGLIDPHVHFNLDLGKTHSKDNFYYGTLQAAYGGITTVIDFLDPVDNPEDLEKAYYKRLNEAKDSVVDFMFHATIKNPKCDLEKFVLKMQDLGISSLKLFTTYSESLRRTYDAEIIELLKLSEKYKFLILAHIEHDSDIDLNPGFRYNNLLQSRPTVAETKEALKLATYVEKYGGYLYMVHLSSGNTIVKLKEEKADILNRRFFVESCPHYFLFSNDCLERDDGYLYTLAPPLRTRKEAELLRQNFSDVFCIGTDHCAFMKSDKHNKYLKDIPLGIGGIEYSFDMMYELFGIEVIDKMSKNIATLYPKFNNLGEIKIGNKANIFIYDLFDNFVDEHHGFTDYTVYENLKRKGRVIHTINRGAIIIKDKVFVTGNGRKV